MARIRTIKPETPQSESLGRVSREARLCFILLWTQADDAGRLRGNSRMLASLLYPYDDDARNLIDGWLGELEREGSIRRYVVNGDHFIDIPKWLDHQKIDRPSASKHPAFDEGSRILDERSRIFALDQGREGTKEGRGPDIDARVSVSQMSVAWEPDASIVQFASLKCVPPEELAEQAELFRDHYLANGHVAADWNARFRLWLNRRHQFFRPAKQNGKPRNDAIRQALDEFNAWCDRGDEASDPAHRERGHGGLPKPA